MTDVLDSETVWATVTSGGSTADRAAASVGSGTSEGAASAELFVHWMSALLYNGLGRYEEAFASAERADAAHVMEPTPIVVLHELVEAAVRSGRADRAAQALVPLCQATRSSGTEWGAGIESRSCALMSDGAMAERSYVDAICRLARTSDRLELARAQLVYGEWLRRANRRVDARRHLREAHEMFTALGVNSFAERSRRELLATGETVRRRSVETHFELTAQEAEIARLAGDGRTNPEIGLELFLSPRTVEWHLRKVFAKLGITSRRQLRGQPAS